MIDEMIRVPLNNTYNDSKSSNVVDIVGTGGDGIGSVNISTGATILTAACGCPVAKVRTIVIVFKWSLLMFVKIGTKTTIEN